MEERPEIVKDETSLMDIYDFILDGWSALLGLSVLGVIVGVAVSFALPVKYQANALIDSGQVGFVGLDQGVSGRPVESLDVVTEKMKSPSFYSDQTLSACGLVDKVDPRQDLVKKLSPSVARNSNFVSVSYQAGSVDDAKTCLESVLADIISSQQPKIEVVANYTKSEIANTQSQLEQARTAIEEQRVDRDKSLALARDQLSAARQELQLLDRVEGNNASATGALSVVQVLNKRSEIQELEAMLLRLQANFTAVRLDRNDQVNRITNRLAALQAAITAPNTRAPQFATPVFAADTKVSPRRSLIVVISLITGGFIGLMVLIVRRAMKHIRAHEAERRAKAIAAK